MKRRQSILAGAAFAMVITAQGIGAQSNARQAPVSSTVNPHGALQESCSMCHQADGWKPVRVSTEFKHAPNKFSLDGAHATTTCMSCHRRLDFKATDKTCASCHSDVHNAELGADCSRCHSTRSFVDRPAMERAHERTRFPLRGAHAAAPCEACHTPSAAGSMRFVNRSVSCAGCHATAFAATKTPDHQAAGFSRECSLCHTSLTWVGARFDHARTAFALTGAHSTATCAGCHSDGTYRGKTSDCVGCHRGDYDGATQPAHTSFPTTCATCHNTTAWPGAAFDHAATRFALTGAHRAVPCSACHSDGVYGGKATDCYACHRPVYEATRNPPHAAAGFGLTCTACHTTTAWSGATFNHAATTFPLTGAHTTTSCAGCHGDGVYRGKSNDCYSCHRTDYTGSTAPNHGAAGFPTTCSSCHTTTTWLGATFSHDASWFPIYSGKHRGRWSSCGQCHPSPTDFRQFTCLTCHEHNQTKMDDTHKEKAGYRYESLQCYACHPRP